MITSFLLLWLQIRYIFKSIYYINFSFYIFVCLYNWVCMPIYCFISVIMVYQNLWLEETVSTRYIFLPLFYACAWTIISLFILFMCWLWFFLIFILGSEDLMFIFVIIIFLFVFLFVLVLFKIYYLLIKIVNIAFLKRVKEVLILIRSFSKFPAISWLQDLIGGGGRVGGGRKTWTDIPIWKWSYQWNTACYINTIW